MIRYDDEKGNYVVRIYRYQAVYASKARANFRQARRYIVKYINICLFCFPEFCRLKIAQALALWAVAVPGRSPLSSPHDHFARSLNFMNSSCLALLSSITASSGEEVKAAPGCKRALVSSRW
jgi:hypothetical protein